MRAIGDERGRPDLSRETSSHTKAGPRVHRAARAESKCCFGERLSRRCRVEPRLPVVLAAPDNYGAVTAQVPSTKNRPAAVACTKISEPNGSEVGVLEHVAAEQRKKPETLLDGFS
jgi:hypothetical protein